MTAQQWLTFYLQCVATPLILTFGGIAIAIGRQPKGVFPFHRAAWLFTGVATVVHGLNKAAQEVFGYFAMRGGKGSAAWDAYLPWGPVFNHSRTFLAIGFLVALLALARLNAPPRRRFWWASASALLVGLFIGIGLGLVEGGFISRLHYSRSVGYDAIELGVLMATLLALLLTERSDRHLWGALAVYGVSLALSVTWLTAFAQEQFGWAPAKSTLPVVRLVARGIMLGLAVHRLLLARRGISVPGLTGRYGGTRPSLTGWG